MGTLQCTREGDSYIPISEALVISYEHWHRYLYATLFSEDRRVLNIACGEGYGSYLLSLNAQMVIGVDISPEAINLAARNYVRDNLEFKVGSVASIPIEGTDVFDLIVSFEPIEHIIANDEQHAFMAEVKRLLKKDGLFIVPIPNKPSCTEGPRFQHEFHVREFNVQRLKDFLWRYFPHVCLLAHKKSLAYHMRILGTDEGSDRTEGGLGLTGGEKEILHTLGLCSEKPIAVHASALGESNERFSIRQARRLAELESALRGKEVRLAELEAGVAAKDAKIADLQCALGEKQAYIQQIHSGHGWRLLTCYFRIRERLLPQGTIRRLLVKKVFHAFFGIADFCEGISNKIIQAPIFLRNLLSTCPPSILIVTHVRFYPPAAGNELRIFNLIKFLKKRGYQIAVLVNPLTENAPLDPDRRRKLHELVDYYEEVGDFDSDQVFSTNHGQPITTEPILERWRHQEQMFCPDALLGRASELIKRFLPCVILAEYVWTSRVLKLAPPGTLRVIDLIDMFSSKAKNVNRYGFDDPLATSADEEKAFLSRADLAIAIQDTEAAAFRELEPTCRVITAGVDFDVATLSDFSPRMVSPPVVLIVASNNPLNVRCVQEFTELAWPTIRKQVPQSTLRIVGKLCHSLVKAGQGIELVPYAADLTHVYRQATVVVNPVYAGTGLKIKSAEALGHGQLLVAWPAGVAGIPAWRDPAYLVSNSWSEMAMEVVHILTDVTFSNKLRAHAREFALANLSADVVYRELDEHLWHCLPQCSPRRLRRALGR